MKTDQRLGVWLTLPCTASHLFQTRLCPQNRPVCQPHRRQVPLDALVSGRHPGWSGMQREMGMSPPANSTQLSEFGPECERPGRRTRLSSHRSPQTLFFKEKLLIEKEAS